MHRHELGGFNPSRACRTGNQSLQNRGESNRFHDEVIYGMGVAWRRCPGKRWMT